MDFDVKILFGRTLPHLGQRSLNHFDNGRYLDAGIGANDGNFFRPLLFRDGLDGVKNQMSNQGAVLAPTEADEPGTLICEV